MFFSFSFSFSYFPHFSSFSPHFPSIFTPSLGATSAKWRANVCQRNGRYPVRNRGVLQGKSDGTEEGREDSRRHVRTYCFLYNILFFIFSSLFLFFCFFIFQFFLFCCHLFLFSIILIFSCFPSPPPLRWSINLRSLLGTAGSGTAGGRVCLDVSKAAWQKVKVIMKIR